MMDDQIVKTQTGGCRYLEPSWQWGFGVRPIVSVIIPAYEEGDGVVPVLRRLGEAVLLPSEIVVVVDSKDDSTISFVEQLAL